MLTMAPTPTAGPYSAEGGSLGVLLCHGFTSTPQSLRPWAEAFAAAGATVRLPLLPGHGTTWQQMNRTGWADWLGAVEGELTRLHAQCATVIVCGLSMGGALALRLAELHPDRVDGLVLVNPSLLSRHPSMRLLPLASRLRDSAAPIAGDIARVGVREIAYDRTPLKALRSLAGAWPVVRSDLPRVTAPLLLMTSVQDHVVEPENSALVRDRVGSTDLTCLELTRSFHVAPLDHDDALLFAESLAFAERVHTARTTSRSTHLRSGDRWGTARA